MWSLARSIELKKLSPLVFGPWGSKIEALCDRYSCRRLLEKVVRSQCCVAVAVSDVY